MTIPSVAVGAAPPDNTADAHRILLQAFQRRLDTDAWHCVVDISGTNGDQSFAESWDIWVDRGRLRTSPQAEGFQQQSADEFQWSERFSPPAQLCIGCVSAATLCWFDNVTSERSGLGVYPAASGSDAFNIVDPRLIGLLPELAGSKPERISPVFLELSQEFFTLSDADPEHGDWQLDFHDGRDTINFVFRLHDDTYLPSFVRRSYTLDGKHELREISLEYRHTGVGWVLQHSHLAEFVDEQQNGSETCVITTLSHGESAPANTFSVAGMGVPAGTMVNWANDSPPPGGTDDLIFDGSSIVPGQPDFSDQLVAAAAPDDQVKSWRRPLIIINCIVVVAIIVLLLRRRNSGIEADSATLFRRK